MTMQYEQPNINLISEIKGSAIAGTGQSFYQDNPKALGSGTYAESFPVPPYLGINLFKLGYLGVRWDFPFAPGERARIRLYRYRKNEPFGSFSYVQITDIFDADDSRDWSWTYDISDRIRNGFNLDPRTDSIAVSNVYTSTPNPGGVRALRVDFALAQSEQFNEAQAFVLDNESWPPQK